MRRRLRGASSSSFQNGTSRVDPFRFDRRSSRPDHLSPSLYDGPRASLQSEAQRLAEAARERAADAFEEIKVSSNQLVDKVRELIEEGNVRRISLRKGDKTLFEIPLTVGAGAAAAALLYNPVSRLQIRGDAGAAPLATDGEPTVSTQTPPCGEAAGGQGQGHRHACQRPRVRDPSP